MTNTVVNVTLKGLSLSTRIHPDEKSDRIKDISGASQLQHSFKQLEKMVTYLEKMKINMKSKVDLVCRIQRFSFILFSGARAQMYVQRYLG